MLVNKSKYAPIQEKQRIQSDFDAKSTKLEEWGIEQLKTAGTKDHLSAGVINAVKEAVAVPEKFTTDMKHLKNIIITLTQNSKINDSEAKAIEDYINKIDELIKLHNELNTEYPLIFDKNTSPEDVIKDLNEKYNDPKFYEMMEQLASLEYDRVKINSICAKYEPQLTSKNSTYNQVRTTYAPNTSPDTPERGSQVRIISTFTIMPTQNLPRISMVVRAINDQLTKFEEKNPDYHLDQQPEDSLNEEEAGSESNVAIENLLALTTGCLKRSGAKNSELQGKIGDKTVTNKVEDQYLSKDSGVNVGQKRNFFLREILNINLNTPIVRSDEDQESFSPFLQEILVKLYPEIFAHNSKGEISVKAGGNSDRFINIYTALGSNVIAQGTLSEKVKLNPKQFDARTLDKLYKSDHNILWLVLKSTKPVGPNFTAEDKIKAYIELAHAYKDEKIGEKNKFEGAYNMAQAAIAMAEKNSGCQKLVHEAFGPKSELGQWIISKHPKKDKANLIENLSQYSYAQYINENAPFKKQVISPSQALLILIDRYKDDPEKEAELKKLYLVGVRVELDANRLTSKFSQNAEDLATIETYLADDYLSSYEISFDKKVINNDPTRRYFETHLAFETVKHQIDSVDKSLLQKQVNLLTASLYKDNAQSQDAINCARIFSGGIREDDSPAYKEYANYIEKIKSKELYGDLNDEQREKIILLVQSSLLGVANAQARGQELPLGIYNKGLYSDNWKGKVSVEDQNTTTNPHMGLMKNYMPLPQDDIATSTNPAPATKPSDQAAFVNTGKAKWVEMNFAGLVHPFSNSISGTMLCQLRNLAEQKNGNKSDASGICDTAEDIERYTRVFIATMLYGSGGHTLNEYTYPLQLDEVRDEFDSVEGFADINLGMMFLDNNTEAFDAALGDAITYNAQHLQRQRLHQDIGFVSLLHDKPTIAKSVDTIMQKNENYERQVSRMIFSKHRSARNEAAIIKPVMDEIISALNKGDVRDSLSLSNELLNKLERECGTKDLTGRNKKSYQMAKEVNEVIIELDNKLSVKENIVNANIHSTEQLQKLQTDTEPQEVVEEPQEVVEEPQEAVEEPQEAVEEPQEEVEKNMKLN